MKTEPDQKAIIRSVYLSAMCNRLPVNAAKVAEYLAYDKKIDVTPRVLSAKLRSMADKGLLLRRAKGKYLVSEEGLLSITPDRSSDVGLNWPWIEKHGRQYAGQHVALRNGELLLHDANIGTFIDRCNVLAAEGLRFMTATLDEWTLGSRMVSPGRFVYTPTSISWPSPN